MESGFWRVGIYSTDLVPFVEEMAASCGLLCSGQEKWRVFNSRVKTIDMIFLNDGGTE